MKTTSTLITLLACLFVSFGCSNFKSNVRTPSSYPDYSSFIKYNLRTQNFVSMLLFNAMSPELITYMDKHETVITKKFSDDLECARTSTPLHKELEVTLSPHVCIMKVVSFALGVKLVGDGAEMLRGSLEKMLLQKLPPYDIQSGTMYQVEVLGLGTINITPVNVDLRGDGSIRINAFNVYLKSKVPDALKMDIRCESESLFSGSLSKGPWSNYRSTVCELYYQ